MSKQKRKITSKTRKTYNYKPYSSISEEEKKVYRRIIIAFSMILLIVFLLYLWGTDLVLVIQNFWRSNSSTVTDQQKNDILLLPPRLDPLPLYTNEPSVVIKGWGQSGYEVQVFNNNVQIAQVLVDKSGRFELPAVTLTEGENIVHALMVSDDYESNSSSSETIILDTTKPTVEYSISEVDYEKLVVVISGTVEQDADLYINNRRIIIQNDLSFNSELSLNYGENLIEIRVEDIAGNIEDYEETIIVEEEIEE